MEHLRIIKASGLESLESKFNDFSKELMLNECEIIDVVVENRILYVIFEDGEYTC